MPAAAKVARWLATSDSGTIEGIVLRVDSLLDQTPAPLVDALVGLVGPLQHTVTVDRAGHFRFTDLSPGQYRVFDRRMGFPHRNARLRDTDRLL
jgi:hypothetical protein